MARLRLVLVVILFSATPIFAGDVTPTHAISCGDTLGPGGNFKLQQDLDCSGTSLPALNVRDGAVLDLNGHIVTCRNLGPCMSLLGADTQVFDGVVGGALHVNLRVEGNGHTVRNVTSGVADGNVVVEGDNNHLINVWAGAGLPNGVFGAIAITGDNNELINSIAPCSALGIGACVSVGGDGNRLTNNFVTVEAAAASVSAIIDRKSTRLNSSH